jgi:UDP-2-acetamido-2,6-beta-L-arabino-hexul-4-ose reductase
MKTVLVTGAEGFIGKNLCLALERTDDARVLKYDLNARPETLDTLLVESDVVVHLAGVNRPEDSTKFTTVNVGLTQRIVDFLGEQPRKPFIIFSSSTQATLENPYGVSKRKAEEALAAFARERDVAMRLFRLPGAFGKWCRPNYNSVVATFCHNIAQGLEISLSDPGKQIELVYVDDIVRKFSSLITSSDAERGFAFETVSPTYSITLGRLAELINGFKDSRDTLQVADGADRLTRSLHATYLSYLPESTFEYSLRLKSDARGALAELLKSPHFGQMFVSRTHPGVTRGNHYHDSKIEKFCVVEGEAIIRFRHILGKQILEYRISGRDFKVVDIPPGYTHSIENVGAAEMVVLFWSNEIFNPESPDTYFARV